MPGGASKTPATGLCRAFGILRAMGRAILARIKHAYRKRRAHSRGTRPAAPPVEPTSILPNAQTPTVFLVQANPLRNDFQFIFASGPNCNVRAEASLTPDQAERVARTILADLEGWDERVAKVRAACGVTAC